MGVSVPCSRPIFNRPRSNVSGLTLPPSGANPFEVPEDVCTLVTETVNPLTMDWLSRVPLGPSVPLLGPASSRFKVLLSATGLVKSCVSALIWTNWQPTLPFTLLVRLYTTIIDPPSRELDGRQPYPFSGTVPTWLRLPRAVRRRNLCSVHIRAPSYDSTLPLVLMALTILRTSVLLLSHRLRTHLTGPLLLIASMFRLALTEPPTALTPFRK